MPPEQNHRSVDLLSSRIAPDAGPDQIAVVLGALWLEISQTLHPIIGHRGVAALYNRSLSVTAVRHPWLALGEQGALAGIDTAALRSAVAQQPAAEAIAGGDALIQSFHDLLGNLVGPDLTQRLLGPVWTEQAPETLSKDPSS